MELILKENVIGLGFKNDIVTVKNGYGRNYLIPTGKAVIASESAKKVLAETMKQQAKKLEKVLQDAQALGQRIEAVKDIVIAVKVSATGSIYGNVTNHHLAAELQQRGIELDRKLISVKDIKTVGEYTATVRLHRDVTVEFPYSVVAEGATAPAKEEAPVEEAPVVEAPVVEETPAEEAE